MPSGARKRKAAKKKKEIQANSSSTQGDDDRKSHGDKMSDGGEASSPASQGQRNRMHPFAGGEEESVEKTEGTSSARSFVSESNSLEGNENARVEEESIIQIDGSEYAESAKEMNDGSSSSKEGGSSSYSSSSDDESHAVKNNFQMVKSGDSNEKPCDLVSENAPLVESVKQNNSFAVDDKSSFAEDVVHVTDSDPVQSNIVSVVAELESAKYGAKVVPIMNENSGDSTAENGSGSTNLMGVAASDNEDNLLLSYNAPKADSIDGSDHVKDPEIPDYCDSQLVVPSRPVQVTSWTSCCGLFEVLKGSST